MQRPRVSDARAFVELVPNVVFELLSPTQLLPTGVRGDAVRKTERYLGNGVDVAVLIDAGSAAIWRRGSELRVRSSEVVATGPEMPEFVLDARGVREAMTP